MQRGASWDSVSGSGWAFRKCAMEPGDDWNEMSEKGACRDVGVWDWGTGCEGLGVDIGGSMTMDTSWSGVSDTSMASGRTSVPSESCLNIRLTAMMPAAPVSADKSAPT